MYSFPLIDLSRVSLFSFRVRLCVVVYVRWFRWLSCRRLSSGMYLLVFMWDCTACSETFVWKVNSSPVGRERARASAEPSCLKTRRVWSCTSSDTRKNFPSFFPSPSSLPLCAGRWGLELFLMHLAPWMALKRGERVYPNNPNSLSYLHPGLLCLKGYVLPLMENISVWVRDKEKRDKLFSFLCFSSL